MISRKSFGGKSRGPSVHGWPWAPLPEVADRRQLPPVARGVVDVLLEPRAAARVHCQHRVAARVQPCNTQNAARLSALISFAPEGADKVGVPEYGKKPKDSWIKIVVQDTIDVLGPNFEL